jgi:hypothetical protein
MAVWLRETTGYEPDLKTVQLVASLRTKFQQSEMNRDHLAERKAAADQRYANRVAAAEARIVAAEVKAKEAEEKRLALLAKKEEAAKAKADAVKQIEEIEEGFDPMDPEAPMVEIAEKPKRKPAVRKPAAKRAPKAVAAK